jgi:hypothetical protein
VRHDIAAGGERQQCGVDLGDRALEPGFDDVELDALPGRDPQ